MYMQCTCSVYAVDMQCTCTCSAHAVHMQCTCTCSVHAHARAHAHACSVHARAHAPAMCMQCTCTCGVQCACAHLEVKDVQALGLGCGSAPTGGYPGLYGRLCARANLMDRVAEARGGVAQRSRGRYHPDSDVPRRDPRPGGGGGEGGAHGEERCGIVLRADHLHSTRRVAGLQPGCMRQ